MIEKERKEGREGGIRSRRDDPIRQSRARVSGIGEALRRMEWASFVQSYTRQQSPSRCSPTVCTTVPERTQPPSCSSSRPSPPVPSSCTLLPRAPCVPCAPRVRGVPCGPRAPCGPGVPGVVFSMCATCLRRHSDGGETLCKV